MDYNKIKEIALTTLQNEVKMGDPANIAKLQESIALAIAKSFEEYHKQSEV